MKTDRQIRAETRFQFYSSPSESSSKATYYKDWPVFLIHAVSTCVSSVPCVPLCFRLSPLFLPRVPETFLARFSGISGSAVNGTRFVGSSHWKIPRKSGKSKKVGRFPGGGEVLPYIGNIEVCRCEGYGFQSVYYINQSVWV